MLLFLIGMMGSGKTTLGRRLAKHLQYTFVDLDAYIERRLGSTIAQLFEREGQERFRELERQALQELVREHGQAVVATGGGAPCFFDNMEFMNAHGKTVFLDVPVKEIVRRLVASDLAIRPLLKDKSEQELNEFIAKTLEHRKQFYRRAQYTLSGKNQTIEAVQSFLHN